MQSTSRRNAPGAMFRFPGEPNCRPSGAVSPSRIMSCAWPFARSAAIAAYASDRYSRGASGRTVPRWTESCGYSQPAWFGSFQIDHRDTRGTPCTEPE
jgi:hypothetical protein